MQRGLDKFYKHKYDDALEAFQQVKERYPFSKYATMAELRVADAQYYKKEYPEAVAAYEDFSRLHPRHPDIPRVLYQIGMCHYKQRLGIDRDQTHATEALQAFERVVKTYPKSEYAKKARSKIGRCKDLLGRHEYYVARFYYRIGEYRASMLRLQTLKTYYLDVKDSELQTNFRELYAKCVEKLGGKSEYSDKITKKKHRFSDIWERVYFWKHKEKEDEAEAQPTIQKTQNNKQIEGETKEKEKKSFWQKLLFWKHKDKEEEE